MILIITDIGDSSVGIQQQDYEIVCPFNFDEVEKADLEYFREEMLNIYRSFSETKVRGLFDFEIKSICEMEDELENSTNNNDFPILDIPNF